MWSWTLVAWRLPEPRATGSTPVGATTTNVAAAHAAEALGNPSFRRPMIALTNVSKQYGSQILFVEASFQLNPGEKMELVGPNGAGKTTVFRMIVGDESPDEGEITVPKRLSIGYYRQDIGEMAGRSVLDETIASSGSLGDLHHELKDLEVALADPERAAELDRILDRFGHVHQEYERAGGYEIESRAREILHGLGFEPAQVDGDVGALSGGWKMRVGLARILL